MRVTHSSSILRAFARSCGLTSAYIPHTGNFAEIPTHVCSRPLTPPRLLPRTALGAIQQRPKDGENPAREGYKPSLLDKTQAVLAEHRELPVRRIGLHAKLPYAPRATACGTFHHAHTHPSFLGFTGSCPELPWWMYGELFVKNFGQTFRPPKLSIV